MIPFTSTHRYADDFKTKLKTGWGCGYVHIPKDHPILVQLLVEENMGYLYYLQPEDCPEEITFSDWDKDREYYVIGFDTAHTYNNDSHDEEYVINRAREIKDLINAYTAEDAHKCALDAIDNVRRKFNKYLL
jgi:hypothetical protein